MRGYVFFLSQIIFQTKFCPVSMARILQLMFQMMKVISFVKDYYIAVIGLVCKSIQGDWFPFHFGMF